MSNVNPVRGSRISLVFTQLEDVKVGRATQIPTLFTVINDGSVFWLFTISHISEHEHHRTLDSELLTGIPPF